MDKNSRGYTLTYHWPGVPSACDSWFIRLPFPCVMQESDKLTISFRITYE